MRIKLHDLIRNRRYLMSIGPLFLIQIIRIIFMFYGFYESDFTIYYLDVNNFFRGESIYNEGFMYLSYFYFLAFYMYLLPIIPALFVHLFLTDLFIYLIIRKLSEEEYIWFIYLIPIIWLSSVNFNVDCFCLFGIYFYHKNRGKWFSPLFLLFSLFKITTIIALGLLIFINLYYEKKIRFIQIPGFLIISLIVILSIIPLYQELLFQTKTTNNKLSHEMNIFIFFQAYHLIWYSFVFTVAINYKEYSELQKIKVYRTCLIITLIYLSIIFIIWISNNYEMYL